MDTAFHLKVALAIKMNHEQDLIEIDLNCSGTRSAYFTLRKFPRLLPI